MNLPIDQVLDNVAERLAKGTGDPKVGTDLAYQVKQYSRSYGKAIQEMRQCQNVTENLDKIVTAFIPMGMKLSSDIWSTLEMFSLWNAETESITDLLGEALVPKRFVEDSVDAIVMGCECRIHPESQPSKSFPIVTKVPREYRREKALP